METRWYGWGDVRRTFSLADRPHFWPALRQRIGEIPSGCESVPLASVAVPQVQLPPAVLERLETAAGRLATDREARIRHSCGKSYKDLVQLRSGLMATVPDAVALPTCHDQVRQVLQAAAADGIPVVPFGGGTSVVGGVAGPSRPYLVLSLRGLDRLLSLDRESHVAQLEAGMLGPQIEEALGARGFTLGHYPQSFEFSTVGGWIAARSAGQQSTLYGRIEDMVVGLRAATLAGDVETGVLPAASEGPDLNRFLAGSEGTLGVITRASLRVRPRPAARCYLGLLMPGFEAGTTAIRTVLQAGGRPAMLRLSDSAETEATFALRTATAPGLPSWVSAVAKRWLGPIAGRCLLVAGFEGSPAEIRAQRAIVCRVLARCGGVSLGEGVGRDWYAHRFDLPYLRDVLLDHGVMVDTLETASSWSHLHALHDTVAGALASGLAAWGTPAWVSCHVSHAYEVGASLYFTFVARQDPSRPLEQWQTAKNAATDAIVAGGGALSHHHGVGRDHAPWLGRRIHEGGLAILRGAKSGVDPDGLMNPGALGLGSPRDALHDSPLPP